MIARVTDRIVDRLEAWVESRPEWMRPAAYGALFIILLMMHRGGWIVAPLAVIIVLVTSDTPIASLVTLFGVVGLAMAGGALGGFAYALAGRRLRFAFRGGRYLAGILTVAPYMFVIQYIVRAAEGKPFFTAPTGEEVAMAAFMTAIFGPFIGHTWFAPDTTPPRAPSPGRQRKRKRRRR